MGFLLVSAVLVVSFGRLGDLYGRCGCTSWGSRLQRRVHRPDPDVIQGADGALWLIVWRVVQGVGGAFLFANSAAIVTDAFPANQRGTAPRELDRGHRRVVHGAELGGVLAPMNWHLIFLVSAPSACSAPWAYSMLHDIGIRRHAKMDWWGNLLFGGGLIAILVGITYGLQPYGGHPMGWTNPWVLSGLFGGLAPWWSSSSSRPRSPSRCSASRCSRSGRSPGNLASLLLAMGRGGMQFMLIIWLQGIWLPLHGYSYSRPRCGRASTWCP